MRERDMGASSARVLVIGATGELGRLIVKASLERGHATYAFVRPASFSLPSKAPLLHSFQSQGATLLQGTLEDHKSLVDAIKQVDIVISSRFVLMDYIVTRGLSNDVEMYGILRSLMGMKETVRKGLEASHVPFTHIITYGFASYYTASLGQLDCRSPPMHKVFIAANGDLKAYMVVEEDIAMLTMIASIDPRTAKKNFHLRLPNNHLSQNDLVSIWESKVGVQLERIYESEEDMRKSIEGNSTAPFGKILKHFTFAKGGHNTSLLKDLDDVEVLDLYPDYEYVKADQYLDHFVK